MKKFNFIVLFLLFSFFTLTLAACNGDETPVLEYKDGTELKTGCRS